MLAIGNASSRPELSRQNHKGVINSIANVLQELLAINVKSSTWVSLHSFYLSWPYAALQVLLLHESACEFISGQNPLCLSNDSCQMILHLKYFGALNIFHAMFHSRLSTLCLGHEAQILHKTLTSYYGSIRASKVDKCPNMPENLSQDSNLW